MWMGLVGVQASSNKQASGIKQHASRNKKLDPKTLARNTKSPLSYTNAKMPISYCFKTFEPIFKFTEN